MAHDRSAESAHREFMHTVLPVLPGERTYIFGMLMYERLVEVARQVYPEGLPDRRTPHAEVDRVLEALWARLPDGRVDSNLALHAAQWQSGDPQPAAVGATVSHYPLIFGKVTIRSSGEAASAALSMWQAMTSAVPSRLKSIEFDAEREDLLLLRNAVDIDVPVLRERSRTVARQLADMGMA